MNFNSNQIKAITSRGNVCVMASAGSGKTSVIIARTKDLIDSGVNPANILLITFSHKAKDEILGRLKSCLELGDTVSTPSVETFHSLALKVIMDKYPGRYKVWTTQWEKEKVLQDIHKELGIFDEKEPNTYLPTSFKFIAQQKHQMLTPADKLNYYGFDELTESQYKRIYVAYEQYKSQKSLIDFDDFLNICYNIFDSDPVILTKYSSQFQYIMADEFQDVNKNQALVLRQLNMTETMIVGDPLQAIYAFRGGDSRYIMNFDQDYPNATVINLDTNYRCKASIVEASNEFASHWIKDTQHHNYVESKASRGGGLKPQVESFSNEVIESQKIAEKILNSLERKYKDFAILTRTNAQLQSAQNGLASNGIPFQVVGGSLYTEQAEIKLLLSYLRLAVNTEDNEAFTYMYNKPNRWLGKKFLDEVNANCYGCSYFDSMFTIRRRNWRFKNGIDQIVAIIDALQKGKFDNVGEMVKFLRQTLPIDDYFNKGEEDDGAKDYTESMNAFQKMCERFTSIGDLTTYLEMITQSKDDNSVKLLTIHKSKGMEFPVVFLPGLDSRHMPHYMSNNIEDEARVMYVAMTRAADELYMSYVGQPSEFLSAFDKQTCD